MDTHIRGFRYGYGSVYLLFRPSVKEGTILLKTATSQLFSGISLLNNHAAYHSFQTFYGNTGRTSIVERRFLTPIYAVKISRRARQVGRQKLFCALSCLAVNKLRASIDTSYSGMEEYGTVLYLDIIIIVKSLS